MTQDRWGIGGRAAIVTGGAMGIGFAIVSLFAEAGGDVLIVDRDEGALQRAQQRLADTPGRVAVLATDVTDKEAGDRAVAACTTAFGSVDILVNNAGIFPMAPVLDMQPDMLERVIGVNLIGLILMSQAVGRRMVEQGTGGRIVNIASIDALHPSYAGLAAYDSSKGGVLMFTKSFALEMAAHGVLVNAIAPGGIDTEGASGPLGALTAEQAEAVRQGFIASIPLRRLGRPEDVARVAAFLVGDGADYMTGSLVTVDGGMLIA